MRGGLSASQIVPQRMRHRPLIRPSGTFSPHCVGGEGVGWKNGEFEQVTVLRGQVNERYIHRVFEFSVILKGAHALIECIGGVALYAVSTSAIAALVRNATQSELIEDPNDFIATRLLQAAQGLSLSSKEFYAFYLLSHGLVKLLLVIGLLRNRLWSYPASLVVLGLFIVYQLYRYSYTHALGLIVLTVFDVSVLALIWHEYRLVRRHLPVK
jgi:uncharacterized membrane protein